MDGPCYGFTAQKEEMSVDKTVLLFRTTAEGPATSEIKKLHPK